jgi:hypothetical protein
VGPRRKFKTASRWSPAPITISFKLTHRRTGTRRSFLFLSQHVPILLRDEPLTHPCNREDWIEMIEVGRLNQTLDPASGAGSSGLSTSPLSNPFALPINWDNVKLVVKGAHLAKSTLVHTVCAQHQSDIRRRVDKRTGYARTCHVSAFGGQSASYHTAARLVHLLGFCSLAGRLRIVRCFSQRLAVARNFNIDPTLRVCTASI